MYKNISGVLSGKIEYIQEKPHLRFDGGVVRLSQIDDINEKKTKGLIMVEGCFKKNIDDIMYLDVRRFKEVHRNVQLNRFYLHGELKGMELLESEDGKVKVELQKSALECCDRQVEFHAEMRSTDNGSIYFKQKSKITDISKKFSIGG